VFARAVKLCRWTSTLRGRGGCYKHTFHNISSRNCTEMTPRSACANNCVFCWRHHHTNPMTKSLSWNIDSPEFFVEQALEKHRRMIAQFKGVPQVTPKALRNPMNIRHCALSLVGELMIYAEINRYCELLHRSRIAPFMRRLRGWPYGHSGEGSRTTVLSRITNRRRPPHTAAQPGSAEIYGLTIRD
jgi:tRNA wybutosine-synthesizing protein 1